MDKFDLSFYKGKRVFITGHTGFKGSWLCKILTNVGAIVTGYSLNPPTSPSLFEIAGIEQDVNSVIGDIRDYKALKVAFDAVQPEIVLHLAAQPIVRDSYKDPAYTYETNVMGTVNILECIRNSSCVKSFVNVTTDKVSRRPARAMSSAAATLPMTELFRTASEQLRSMRILWCAIHSLLAPISTFWSHYMHT